MLTTEPEPASTMPTPRHPKTIAGLKPATPDIPDIINAVSVISFPAVPVVHAEILVKVAANGSATAVAVSAKAGKENNAAVTSAVVKTWLFIFKLVLFIFTFPYK
jgi:hypothetical protein